MAAKDLKFLLYVLGLISVGNCVRYDCKNMLPSQTVPYKLMTDGSPFMLHIVDCNPHCVYRPGGKITVYLKTKDPKVHFTSFIVKARLPSGSESTGSPVGTWEVEPQGGARLETCIERERSVVRNVNEDPHDSIKLTWNAPTFDDSPGTVEFIASAMSSNGELWKFSSVLVEEDNTPLSSRKPPTQHLTTRHPTRHSTTRHPTHTPTTMPAHIPSSTSGPPVPSTTTHPPEHKTHKPTPRPTHAVPDVEKEGTDQNRDDNEQAAPRNQEEGTGPRDTGEDPNEPEAREKEEMEDAKRHDEQGPDAGPNPDHDLDQEDVAFVKWQEKQQHLMDDEDQNSEGWQAEEARDKAQREAEYKWEMETYERNKFNDEKEREERIRAEIMDKEEHDKVERTTTTTTTKPKPKNELDIIDDKEVEVDDNGIKNVFSDRISGSSRMVYSFASLLMTMLVLLV